LPWINKEAFRDEMVREELVSHAAFTGNSGIVFFDRGVIDSYGYSMLEHLPISKGLLKNCHELEYSKKVFIFPPWRSIYINDQERKQEFCEAVATFDEMVKAYKKFGYELVEVPKCSVSERVEFILGSMKNA